MSDNEKPEKPEPEPMTDEAITSIVAMVRTAELVAQALGLPVSQALEYMLKTAQIMTRMKQQLPTSQAVADLASASKTLQ